MNRRGYLRIGLTAVILVVASFMVFHFIKISRDLSFFQPGVLSETARLAIEQVRNGPASRLILVGIENAPTPELARISKGLVETLGESPTFSYVANGATQLDDSVIDFLLANRYLLGPSIYEREFSATFFDCR